MTKTLHQKSGVKHVLSITILLALLLIVPGQRTVAAPDMIAEAEVNHGAVLPPFKVIASGYITCAVTDAGALLCWGYGRAFPAVTGGLTRGVQTVSVGMNHVCVLTTAGGVKCWGDNAMGQIGDGTTINRNMPVDVVGLTSDVQAIAAGYEFTCALTGSGGVKCWGRNDTGQLGNDSTVQSNTPTDVVGLSTGVKSIAAAGGSEVINGRPLMYRWFGHVCAAMTAGGVMCWGDNQAGQLGNNIGAYASSPVEVTGLAEQVQALAAGEEHTCALTSNGGAKCWGDDFWGQLGNDIRRDQFTPTDVLGLAAGVQAIAAYRDQSCAVTTTGAALCWGAGVLGNGSDGWSRTPVLVELSSGSYQTIAVGDYRTCALLATGAAQCWGLASGGVLGNFTMDVHVSAPVRPTYLRGNVFSVAPGWKHTCALMILPPETSRHVACWGTVIDDDPGSIGWILPRVVSGFDGDIAAISSFGPHDCALTTDGAARCWGPNRYGQLGDGTTEVRAAATAVSGLAAGVAQIAVGRFHTCALLTKGQLKCWGANFAGQLGDGTTEERHAPVLIDAGGLVRAVAAGSSISCALIDDGSVRCWGDWLTKVPVTVDLGGEIATAIAAGNDHACALMADGGLKCWGRNRVGQVGDGTQIDRTAAVDVVGLEGGVESVAAAGTRTCAIRSDGGVMCWGAEETYSTPQARLLPEPIIGLEGRALAVVVADRHVCVLGQEAEGATPVVQCWGDNASGELGVNNGWLPVDVTVPDAFSFLPYSSKQ